jgi:segregation and condensation protein A
VQDALARITRLLRDGAGGDLGIFLPRIPQLAPDHDLRCRAALASTLVAGLELARSGALVLVQSEPGQPVRFCRAAADEQETAAAAAPLPEERHGEPDRRSLH